MTDQPWTDAEIAGAKALASRYRISWQLSTAMCEEYLKDARVVLDAAGAALRAEADQRKTDAENGWAAYSKLLGEMAGLRTKVEQLHADRAEVAVHPVEFYCEVMHDAYEAAAAGAGWETQQASRKPWSDVPEPNKATMRAAVRALLDAQGLDAAGIAALRAEIKRLEWFEDDWKLNDGAQYQEHAEAERLLNPHQMQAWEDARRGDVRSFSKRLATLAATVRRAGDPS